MSLHLHTGAYKALPVLKLPLESFHLSHLMTSKSQTFAMKFLVVKIELQVNIMQKYLPNHTIKLYRPTIRKKSFKTLAS